jgi:hypothetical protein
VWKAVPYIRERTKRLSNYQKSTESKEEKSEGSGRQNDDEKATSGSLIKVF